MTNLNQSNTPIKTLTIAQGVLAMFSFAWLLAGSNATTALIPLYRTALAFSPLEMSLTFGCYVTVLVPALFLMANPRLARFCGYILVVAMIASVFSGAIIAQASTFSILSGRAVSGVAVGLATGAASALVVLSLGERGRAVSATGNTTGAIVGTFLGQLCVYYFQVDAMALTYEAHASISGLLAVLLSVVLFLRRKENRLALASPPQAASPSSSIKVKLRLVPTLTGCLAWIAISLTTVFLPTLFAYLKMPFAQAYGALSVLIACSLGQIFSGQIGKVFPKSSGAFLSPAGILTMLLGCWLRSESAALAGILAAGTGIGISYRLGLLANVHGTPIAEQAALASRYAAVTYLAALIAVVCTGLVGNLVDVTFATTIFFAATAVLFLLILTRAPQLVSLK